MTIFNLTTLTTTPLNNIALKPAQIGFRGNEIKAFPLQEYSNGNQDNYITNPLLSRVLDVRKLEAAMKSPEVQAILRENKLPNKLNKKAIETITSHMQDTRIIAAKIASNIGNSEIDLKSIQEAALLHDVGKVLIPDKILNKNGCLNADEKKIMDLHSELGYALLKQMGVNETVLRLVKYHHQKPDGTGYPQVDNDFEFDINAQILEAADKYSALTEDRAYHKECTKEKALEIIYKEVEAGVISQEVFDALERSVQ